MPVGLLLRSLWNKILVHAQKNKVICLLLRLLRKKCFHLEEDIKGRISLAELARHIMLSLLWVHEKEFYHTR